MEFVTHNSDDLGVFHNENYRIVSCYDGHIVFSYAQKGKAMTAHIASDKIGLRHIKPAINDFCDWLFSNYDGCKVIFAVIDKKLQSVVRIVKKCNFSYLTENEAHSVYMRPRQ